MSLEKSALGSVLRWALRFGVGAGALYALWLVGLKLTGNNPFGAKRVLMQFAVPIAVVASQWMLRRSMQPGRPGLRRALGVGVLTALLGAMIAAGSLYSLGQAATPQALQRNRTEMLAIARLERDYFVKQGGGEAVYQQRLRQLEQLTIGEVAQSDFSKILLLGLMFALPAGIFLRE
jgi:hypothetical protein